MNEGKCCANNALSAPTCEKKPTIADNITFASGRLTEIDAAEERILSFLEERNVGADACKPEITCMMDQADYIAGQATTVADKLARIGNLLGAFQG